MMLIITIKIIISIIYLVLIVLIIYFVQHGWIQLDRIWHELNHRKPIIYVIPMWNIFEKMSVIPDTWEIPRSLHTAFCAHLVTASWETWYN